MVGVEVELSDVVPEPCEQDGDLDGPAGDQVVEADGAPRVVLQEDHEEAEADEDHDVHILEQGVFLLQEICRLIILLLSRVGASVFSEFSE